MREPTPDLNEVYQALNTLNFMQTAGEPFMLPYNVVRYSLVYLAVTLLKSNHSDILKQLLIEDKKDE